MDKITKSSLLAYALSDEGKQLLSRKTKVERDYERWTHPEIKQAIEFVQNPDNNAAGLAAPQIGIDQSWFVAKKGREQKVVVVINPTIVGRMGNKQHIESCFSELLPARVKRAKEITVKYETFSYGENGAVLLDDVKENLDGLDAQVFQHEYDHLLGILIAKRGVVIKKE